MEIQLMSMLIKQPVADLVEDLAEWATRNKCIRTTLNELAFKKTTGSPSKRLVYTFKNTTIYQYYTKQWWGLFVSWYRVEFGRLLQSIQSILEGEIKLN
jgi:hypothetical protein